MIYFDLFVGFLKVGCFAFGGAYGAIPLIRDAVLKYGWLSDETVSYMIAVSESTPGPIMLNLATYVGSSQAGMLGALLATTAVILPSYVIILIAMVLLKTHLKNPHVAAIINGLKPCVAGIIMATGTYMVINNCIPFASGLVDIRAVILTVLLGAVLYGEQYILKKKVSPITLIAISAVLGILIHSI